MAKVRNSNLYLSTRRKTLESILPSYVLETILERLPLPDLVRTTAVSSSWKSSADNVLRSKSHPERAPWLLLPPVEVNLDEGEQDDYNEDIDSDEEKEEEEIYVDSPCRLMSVEEQIVYSLDMYKTMSTVLLQNTTRCIGSSHGWLILLDERSQHPLSPFPVKPFRGGPNSTPSLKSKSPSGELITGVTKAILTAEPVGEYGVFLICQRRITKTCLAFYKNGHSFWTQIEDSDYCYEDIICYKNQIYAAVDIVFDDFIHIHTWDFQGCRLGKRIIITTNYPEKSMEELGSFGDDCTLFTYLVESRGEILLVARFVHHAEDDSYYWTKRFDVYKLDMENENWVEVNSLQDRSLFLGINHSISVSTNDLQTCKPNSIYFTDDFWYAMGTPFCRDDIGIFCLEDESVLKIEGQIVELPQKIWPLLCWIVPNSYH